MNVVKTFGRWLSRPFVCLAHSVTFLCVKGGPWVASGVVVVVAVLLAVRGAWPFQDQPPVLDPTNPNAFAVFFGDGTTLGFVRLATLSLGLFILASVPALIVQGRWLKGFGTSGLTADDAQAGAAAVSSLTSKLKQAQRELTRTQDALDQAIHYGEVTSAALEEARSALAVAQEHRPADPGA